MARKRTARSKTKRVYLDNDTQEGYSVDAYEEFTYSYENDDADGNRGQWMWLSDGVTIVEWYFNDKAIAEKDVPDDIISKMDTALDNNDFEPEDYD